MENNTIAKICNKCGTENPDNARFCIECGSALTRKRSSQKQQKDKKISAKKQDHPQPLNSYIYIAGAFIIALVIVLLILNDNRTILREKIAGSAKGGAGQSASAQQAAPPAEAMAQVNALKEKVNANPNDVQSVVQLANLYFDVGKFDQAIGYYKRALNIEPNNTSVLIDLGVSYFNINQGDSALTFMHQALKVAPDHKQGLYNIGIVYYNLNQMDKAIYYWDQLIKKYPQSREAQNAQSFVEQVKQQMNL
ncbi:MAG TPA: tetratricopeptide repeat protein [Caldithrix abyssi]|uniref:Tetratricopeptide repeat protein n=1 Tax=Caldithrix abyssi TaxID=187145 RepID=A0A7V4WWQ2_CALAY|nr:tetratricopeptide repeat protein [Caldithrix abyssi]